MSYDPLTSQLVAYAVSGINGKTTGATTIYTTDANLGQFYPLAVSFELTAQSGITIVSTIAVGTNSSSFNNILAASALTGLAAVNNMLSFSLTTLISSVAPSTAIKVNVTVGATATTFTFKAMIVGFYA